MDRKKGEVKQIEIEDNSENLCSRLRSLRRMGPTMATLTL